MRQHDPAKKTLPGKGVSRHGIINRWLTDLLITKTVVSYAKTVYPVGKSRAHSPNRISAYSRLGAAPQVA